MKNIILLGLNELNFEMVRRYADAGQLPNFKKLFDTHPVIETTSETKYEELEPWIQWVSVQTGKSYAEHKIFRLGDVVDGDMTQIWEHLEGEYGAKVAAISPMNAANRCIDPAFFIPDPWTKTTVTGNWLLTKLAGAVADAVNENATGKSKLISYVYILMAVLWYVLPRNPKVVLQIIKALRTGYERAILLDMVLAEIFMCLYKAEKPQFASLFLNSCAHLQHHYLYSSAQYEGPHKNPDWYIEHRVDPVLDGYKMYDTIIGRLLSLKDDPRIIITTGLHQVAVEEPVFYWRLKDHGAFLQEMSVPFKNVLPRMSRDFLIEFEGEADCAFAESKLASCVAEDGVKIFEEIDNRGSSLFVTLTYPNDIAEETSIRFDGGVIPHFKEKAGFVAIKNGHHDGIGYLVDTENMIPEDRQIKVTDIFELIDHHFAREEREQQAEAA
jgi:hypothetical protein